MHTPVAIIGAGPAGLLLARLLDQAGIGSVVLESRDRAYVEARQRAGILEQSTVDALRACGASGRMDREGIVHRGIELRFAGRSHRIDFPAHTEGKTVMVYAQTEVVKDLIDLRLTAGTPLHFEAEVRCVTHADTDRAEVHYRHAGREQTLTCDWVVGCDGFHGVAKSAIPEAHRRTYERTYPYSWLGILADAPPVYDELIYAHSKRGFALASMRSHAVSRLYLQVPNGTDAADWEDARIWDELDARLALHQNPGWRLERGAITGKSVLPMRSHVTEPMRHGRVLLAGDAAHIVPPTGAKGLNLAAGDVIVLAQALCSYYADGSTELLDAYSDTRLDRVWRAEHFSFFMTTMLHRDPDQSEFDTHLQLSQLERVAASPHAAAELALNYVGAA
jgi:p-hydroxybenzoate 3-monooxygenase